MSMFSKDQEFLVCYDCGFHHAIGAAAKPVCPECRSRMDLITGLPEELEEIHSSIKKAETTEEIQAILKSINSLSKDNR